MTFRKLASKNVRGNWQQYSAFFLSSVFSVMIFYIFSAFIYHPDVINGKISAADKVRLGLVSCQYIILVFSFFFVLYSISAFLKSRKKEFGLLSLFGMTSGQIKRMVLYENILISLFAIGAGIGLGALFSKLFFMALAELLDVKSPIRFQIPPTAVWLTAGWFFLLFMVITLMTLWKVGRSEIIELLHAARKPKTPPLTSRWLVILSVVCLAAGYYLAYTVTNSMILLYMLPILFLTMLGTYFLFTQTSVAALRKLQNRKSLYYNRTNLVTVSTMTFKMKDNARILFMVSILSAVILTASGTFYVFFEGMKEQITRNYPQTLSFKEQGLEAHRVFEPDKLRQLFREEGLDIERETKVVGLPVSFNLRANDARKSEGAVISESDYNAMAANIPDVASVQVEPGHGVFNYPYPTGGSHIKSGTPLDVSIGGEHIALQMDEERIANLGAHLNAYLFVVDDEQFASMSKQVKDEDKLTYYSFDIKNWQSIEESLGEKLKLAAGKGEYYAYLVDVYKNGVQLASLTMFVGLFVSVLFFVASGSLLYFKMFTELGEDQRQFAALARIGMSRQEISRTVTSQIGILFFVPCLIGIVHTAFAMKALGNVLNVNTVVYGAIVIAIYIAMQLIYFMFARRSYMKKLLRQA